MFREKEKSTHNSEKTQSVEAGSHLFPLVIEIISILFNIKEAKYFQAILVLLIYSKITCLQIKYV